MDGHSLPLGRSRRARASSVQGPPSGGRPTAPRRAIGWRQPRETETREDYQYQHLYPSGQGPRLEMRGPWFESGKRSFCARLPRAVRAHPSESISPAAPSRERGPEGPRTPRRSCSVRLNLPQRKAALTHHCPKDEHRLNGSDASRLTPATPKESRCLMSTRLGRPESDGTGVSTGAAGRTAAASKPARGTARRGERRPGGRTSDRSSLLRAV